MNKEFLQSLREQIKSGTVTEQEPMSRHTSFSIGGPADVFVHPDRKELPGDFCAGYSNRSTGRSTP